MQQIHSNSFQNQWSHLKNITFEATGSVGSWGYTQIVFIHDKLRNFSVRYTQILTNLTKYPGWRPQKRRLQGLCIGGIAIPTRPNLTFQAILKQSDLERGKTQLNEWWLPLLPLQQTGRIVLTRVKRAKQNLQDFYTLRSSWPNKCQGKSFLVKGLMTKSDTMLIGILVDLQGPKQVFPSCHFTCSNLANG